MRPVGVVLGWRSDAFITWVDFLGEEASNVSQYVSRRDGSFGGVWNALVFYKSFSHLPQYTTSGCSMRQSAYLSVGLRRQL